MTIKFYEKGKPYYQFTNFYEGKPIIVNLPIAIADEGRITESDNPTLQEWKTAELLFQACKFINQPEIAEQIRNCYSSREAFSLARANKYKQSTNWFKVNISVMKWVLEKKFTQNEELKQLLLSTGDEELIEDSGANDAFWGNGADGNGRNELGKALMWLREKLRSEILSPCGDCPVHCK